MFVKVKNRYIKREDVSVITEVWMHNTPGCDGYYFQLLAVGGTILMTIESDSREKIIQDRENIALLINGNFAIPDILKPHS